MSTTQVAVEDAAAQPEVEGLSDDTRREIVELRQGGMTLSELRKRFPQLSSEQIREVLPPANARERKAREAKAPKAQPKQEETKADTPVTTVTSDQPEPKPARYVEDLTVVRALAERLMGARAAGVGQAKIAAEAGVLAYTPWRAERRLKVTADELTKLTAALDRIDKWEKVPRVAAKGGGPTKAELAHRIDTTVKFLGGSLKGMTVMSIAEAALAILDPQESGSPPA